MTERIPFYPERNNIPPSVERGGTVLPVTTEPRPGTITPTRETPPPPTREQQTLHEAIIDSITTTTTTDLPKRKEKEKKPLTTVAKAVRIGATVVLLGGTAVGVALGKHFLREDNSSPADSKTQPLGSVSTSFNNSEGPQLVETREANPEEVFDPSAKEILITSNNSVQLTQEEYDALPVIDPNNPDAVINTLPLKLNIKDGELVKLKLRRQSGYISGGHILGSTRHINSKLEYMEDGRWDYTREGQINNVLDTLIIEEGLTVGSELAFFYDANELHGVTIERLGEEKADERQVLRTESFVIKAFNNNNYPNEYGDTGDHVQIIVDVDSSMQLVKNIPPSTTKVVEQENGTKGYKKYITPVPLGSGESYVRITKPSRSKYYNGQAMISVSSRVQQSDGTINGGAAGLILAKINNKFVLIINKPQQETTPDTPLK